VGGCGLPRVGAGEGEGVWWRGGLGLGGQVRGSEGGGGLEAEHGSNMMCSEIFQLNSDMTISRPLILRK
jgi:hypothetical protein